MSIKPILFNTEMVRAILDGRKTVTSTFEQLAEWLEELKELRENQEKIKEIIKYWNGGLADEVRKILGE